MIDVEAIVEELSSLEPGWFEAQSVPPSKSVIEDIRVALESLPIAAQAPGVEVDPDDGSVVLRWLSPDVSRMFSLSVFGSGSVIGHLSADSSLMKPWTLSTQDTTALRLKLADPAFKDLLENTI